MNSDKKIFGLIGLAARARKVASGGFMTENAIKSGKSHMVLLSVEASDNTKKKFTNMCAHYKIPIYIFGSKDELGHAMGKEMRASLAVTDGGFANNLKKHLEETGSETEVAAWQK